MPLFIIVRTDDIVVDKGEMKEHDAKHLTQRSAWIHYRAEDGAWRWIRCRGSLVDVQLPLKPCRFDITAAWILVTAAVRS